MLTTIVKNFLSRKSIKPKDKTARGIEVSSTSVTTMQKTTQIKHEIFDDDMICRVCTNPADTLLSGKFNLDTTIMGAIRTVANITINETDNYPKYICMTCLDDLKIAYNFKRRCEESDMNFRKAIPSETLIGTNSKLIVSHDFSLILHQMKQRRLELQKMTKQIKIDDTDNGVDTKEEILWDNDENIPESDNSCDNEVISSLVKNFRKNIKDINLPKTNKKDTMTKTRKVILRTKKKNETRNSMSRILQIINRKKETKQKLKIKTVPILKNMYECKPCGLKFDMKIKYEAHRRKNNCLYNPCPQCGKLVMNLPLHEKTVHIRADKYTCDQCGKIYYSSSALRNHLNIHKDAMEYSCDLCPYKAKRKAYLVGHMRVHTGERRYLCAKCPANFSNCSNLRKHQAVHNDKMFECSKCKKMFRQHNDLKTHFDYAHLNVRYRCSICAKELCSRKKLLRHELRVHKREKHKLFENEQQVIISNDK